MSAHGHEAEGTSLLVAKLVGLPKYTEVLTNEVLTIYLK